MTIPPPSFTLETARAKVNAAGPARRVQIRLSQDKVCQPLTALAAPQDSRIFIFNVDLSEAHSTYI
jgi:hypothetical protein